MKNKEQRVECKIDLSEVPNAFDIIMSAVRDELSRKTKSLDEPDDLADQAYEAWRDAGGRLEPAMEDDPLPPEGSFLVEDCFITPCGKLIEMPRKGELGV